MNKIIFLGIFLFCCGSANSLHAQLNISFSQPTDGYHYQTGDEIYVLVDVTGNISVNYVELFLNNTNNLIDRESRYPYEWNSRYDAKLRNLSPGRYELIARANVNAGTMSARIVIYVDGQTGNVCAPTSQPRIGFSRPSPNTRYNSGAEIRVGATASYQMSYVDLYLDDCTNLVRRENRFPYEWNGQNEPKLRNLNTGEYTLILVGYDLNGRRHIVHRNIYIGERPGGGCVYPYGFTCYEDTEEYYKGTDLYVEVEIPGNRDHIDYVELFVNGQSYGRELYWPYQWGTGFRSNGNRVLNNMELGVYDLRCMVVDNCGGDPKYETARLIINESNYCDAPPFYGFDNYSSGYSITNNEKWARVSGYSSPKVGTHGLNRTKTLEVRHRQGAALDLGLLSNGGNYKIKHYKYIPSGYSSLIGFYDDQFNTVMGASEPGLQGGTERWHCMEYHINMRNKTIRIYKDGELVGSASNFVADNIRYLVFHGEQSRHRYYIDDVQLLYNCIL